MFPNKSISKVRRNLNAASKTQAGKMARRLAEMAINMSPASASYRTVKETARVVRRKNKPQKESKSISMCGAKFMLAGTDPFATRSMGACIPDGSVVDSVRGFAKTQVNVTIGTAGIGFVQFSPSNAFDAPSIIYTLATFTGNSTQWLSANNTLTVGVDIAYNTTSAATSNLINGGSVGSARELMSARLVAAGVTFRYTGKEIDRAGQVYAYTSPSHNSASSTVDANGNDLPFTSGLLASFTETLIVEPSRVATTIPLFPVNVAELDFSNNENDSGSVAGNTGIIYPWSDQSYLQPGGFHYTGISGIYVGQPVLTIMFQGTPGSSYICEYGQHTEYIGRAVNSYAKQPADSDPDSVRDIMAAQSRFVNGRARDAGVDPVKEYKKFIVEVQSARSRRVAL